MAGKTLAVNVTVGGETFPAGSTPPVEIAMQIDNPKAWNVEAPAEPVPAKKTAAKRGSSSD
jgi:hypothetical protein